MGLEPNTAPKPPTAVHVHGNLLGTSLAVIVSEGLTAVLLLQTHAKPRRCCLGPAGQLQGALGELGQGRRCT